MSWLEEMAISIILGALHQFVKNPAKQAAMRTLLLGVADDIYVSYQVVPPTHS